MDKQYIPDIYYIALLFWPGTHRKNWQDFFFFEGPEGSLHFMPSGSTLLWEGVWEGTRSHRGMVALKIVAAAGQMRGRVIWIWLLGHLTTPNQSKSTNFRSICGTNLILQRLYGTKRGPNWSELRLLRTPPFDFRWGVGWVWSTLNYPPLNEFETGR